LQQLPLIVCPPVQVDQVIVIPPVALELPLVDSTDTVRIAPPCVHSGPDSVNARLISYELREGQVRLMVVMFFLSNILGS